MASFFPEDLDFDLGLLFFRLCLIDLLCPLVSFGVYSFEIFTFAKGDRTLFNLSGWISLLSLFLLLLF
jgi:hypothetical protein